MSWDSLTEFAEESMQKHRVPGVAVGLYHDGEVKTAGFGVTNVKHPLTVTDETLFQIGSITKTFTGTMAMRLVEDGKLDLDATVRTYLPNFRVADESVSEQVTLRHLMTHTGGWEGDFFFNTRAGEAALARYVEDMAKLEQVSPLGAYFSYNNAGFSLLGHIIEVVTGDRFEETLQELVLKPLGLDNTFIEPTDVMTRRYVSGHNVGDAGAQVAPLWALTRSAFPAGGIICDIKDLLAYARFHLGDGSNVDGEQILASDTLASMQTQHVKVWDNEGWGLSWAVDDYDGKVVVSHGGGTFGQISYLSIVPEHDMAIGIVTNADEGGQVTKDVNRWALKEYAGIEISDPEPIEAGPDDLTPYVGHYTRPFLDIDLAIVADRLIGIANIKGRFPHQDAPLPPPMPPFSVGLVAKDHLIALDGPFKDMEMHIIRRDDGSIGWLRAGRLLRRED